MTIKIYKASDRGEIMGSWGNGMGTELIKLDDLKQLLDEVENKVKLEYDRAFSQSVSNSKKHGVNRTMSALRTELGL